MNNYMKTAAFLYSAVLCFTEGLFSFPSSEIVFTLIEGLDILKSNKMIWGEIF